MRSAPRCRATSSGRRHQHARCLAATRRARRQSADGQVHPGDVDRIGGTFGGITAVTGSDATTTANTVLVGPNGTQTFNVSGPNTGSVAGVTFTQIGNLTGGTGADTFAFATSGTLSGGIDGGGGTNTLDLHLLGTADFSLTSATAGIGQRHWRHVQQHRHARRQRRHLHPHRHLPPARRTPSPRTTRVPSTTASVPLSSAASPISSVVRAPTPLSSARASP